MSNPVQAVPDRYHAMTPALICVNASKAIEFYKSVFGATEIMRLPMPDGKVMHSELQIGDSKFFVNDSMGKVAPAVPAEGASNLMYLIMYVPDVDKVFNRAVEAGSRVDMPVQDMFWGDRYGKLTDPFGQQWGLATHKEDVAPDEMKRRQDALFAKSAGH